MVEVHDKGDSLSLEGMFKVMRSEMKTEGQTKINARQVGKWA